MKKCFAFSLLAAGLFHSGLAQSFVSITGKVLSEGGERLPFSTVYVTGTTIGTIANEIGEFQLYVPDSHVNDSLIVSHVGFHNYHGVVGELSAQSTLSVVLQEAIVNLNEIAIETERLTAEEIFDMAITQLINLDGYPTVEFKMDGFYREIHTSEGERTGVLECAIEVYDDAVTEKFKDIVIPQFRKVYDRQKNMDQFIATKEGHNHLLLLLNNGINLIPIGKQYRSSVWQLPLELEKVTYYNDRLVYILSNKSSSRALSLVVDAEDYSIYKNELTLQVEETDYDKYFWRKVNAKGEKCGAMMDRQGYEYRKINGKLYPYYAFRSFDFRCYDLVNARLSAKSTFTTELLINQVTPGVSVKAADKLKKKQGLINRKEPYDSAFWRYFNDIQDISKDDRLIDESIKVRPHAPQSSKATKEAYNAPPLKIGNHATTSFNRIDSLYGMLSPLLSCYDVRHYDLSIDVDPVTEWLMGTSAIRFTMKVPSSRIRIDLWEDLDIRSIQFEGRPLQFTRDADAVYVQFPRELKEGETHILKVNYEGHPLEPDFDVWASGFLWDRDEDDKPFLQSLCQGYGAKAWFPVKNHLSDEPDSATIQVTVPEDLFAVSNGQFLGKTTTERKATYHWKVTNPINTYNLAVHIGNYSIEQKAYNNLIISNVYLSNDQNLANKRLSIVPKVLEVYEDFFGPYPFPEDGVKIVQSPYPMEHQSCVAVGKYFDDQLILHEVAHEWWGNSVSITDNADIWINEAFATYAESLYIEATLGYTLGQEYLNAKKNEIHNDHPLVGIHNVNHFHYRIEDKYFKGALILNTLRHLVDDDDLWFQTLKRIQADFRHGFIDTEVLIDYFNEQLGQDYSEFFHYYLYTTNIPILRLEATDESGVRYRLENVEHSFQMEVKVHDQPLHLTTEWQQTSMNLSELKDLLEPRYLLNLVK